MSSATAAATTAAEKVYWAGVKLRELIDNDEAEDADDYRVVCDECAALVGEDTYSMYDGLCDACHAAMYFTCDACGEEFHLDEMVAEFPKFCVHCGCEKHRQIVEELNDRLTEVIGSWDGEETEIGRLRKLLSYAKRLK